MSQFSEKLGAFMERSHLTEQQLSKASGFTRSYIALMKSGLRISPDTEKMGNLFAALGLTPYEREELWADYMRAKFGDSTYELQTRMISLIQSFKADPPVRIHSGFNHEIPDISAVNGRQSVEQIIRTVIEKEAAEDKPHLRLILQPDLDSIFGTIYARHVSDPGMKIEQIIGLEQGTEGSQQDKIANLKAFSWMIPLMVHSENDLCRFYYFHDRLQAHFNASTLLPYLVLTSRYAVCVSIDYTYALILDRPEQLEMFGQLFERQKERCFEAGVPLKEYSRKLSYVLAAMPDRGRPVSIGSQPRMSFMVPEELADKYLALSQEEKKIAVRLIRKELELLDKGGPGTAFFTESGIRRLMEEGTLDMVSELNIPPVKPSDRVRMIEHLIHLISEGKLKAFLLDENRIDYPKELIATAYDRKQVIAVYLAKRPKMSMAIQEHTLMEMIWIFLEGLENSPFVRTSEETLKFLQNIVLQQQV